MSEHADELIRRGCDRPRFGKCHRISMRTGSNVTGDTSDHKANYRTPLERRVDELLVGSRART